MLRPVLVFAAISGLLAMIPFERGDLKIHYAAKFRSYYGFISSRLARGSERYDTSTPFTVDQAYDVLTNPQLERVWGEARDPKVSWTKDAITIEVSGIHEGFIPPSLQPAPGKFTWIISFDHCKRWADIQAGKFRIQPDISREEFLKLSRK